MASVLELLAAGKTLVLDGGMGSELIARGLQGGEHWNVERPDVILAVHRDYHEAGARILLTNTFGANRMSLARHRQSERVAELNRAGVALAREAVGADGFVAGDMGSTGQLLEPFGDGTPEEMLDVFAEQAACLAEAGVDLFVVETMTDPRETALAVQACRQVARLPVAASLSFDPAGAGGYRTMMGTTPADAARALEEAGADIIGTNCGTVSPAQMAEIVAQLRAATTKPLFCEANAGAPEMVAGAVRYAQTPEQWLEGVRECWRAGARVLGGCCGTTPGHIRLLAEWVATL